jgi:amino acid transporter
MSESQESLSRDMSLFDITMIGVGAMIGAGIFVLTGKASGVAGPALILAFALNGIVALLTAMVYAELGSAIPEAGGGYLWIKEGLPGANAFLAGWMSWFAHAVAGALYALGFGAFITEILHFSGLPMDSLAHLLGNVKFVVAWTGMEVTDAEMVYKFFGLVVALLFGYINFRGASETGLAGNIVTVAKVIVIGIFVLFGLKFMFGADVLFSAGSAEAGQGNMGTEQLRPFITDETGWIGILSAMGFTFIAFEGYEIIVQAGEEVENPRENIPKAVFWSLTIVIPIYLLVAFVLVGGTFSNMIIGSVQPAKMDKIVEGPSERRAKRVKALETLGYTTYQKLSASGGEHGSSASGEEADAFDTAVSELKTFNSMGYQEAPATIKESFSEDEWNEIKIRNFEVLEYIGELGLARASQQFVPFGLILILVGGLLSTMSALNATTFSSTRVSFAMGRDKNLPDQFGDIHPETRTPYMALFWTVILICSMVLFVPIETVAGAADVMFLLLFFQVCIASITLRKKYGDKLAYGYLMPFFPVLPILAMIGMLAIAVFMVFEFGLSVLLSVAWILVGFVIYRVYARKREREKEAPPVLAEERPVDVKPHSVLIPVADPEAAKDHIRVGGRMARKLDSELILLHVITVPPQLPPSAGSDFVQEARPVIDRARDYAEEQFDIPVRTIMRVGHKPAKAIIHTAMDQNTEYLIMGWKGKVHHKETVIGSNIDNIMVESNVNSIVMQKNVNRPSRILVPIANPENCSLALGTASMLLDEAAEEPQITALHLSDTEITEADKTEFRETIEEYREVTDGTPPESLFTDDVPFTIEFDTTEAVVDEIGRRSETYDTVILGTSRGGWTGRKVFGEIPTLIAQEVEAPVVLVREKEAGPRFEMQKFFQFFRRLEEMGNPQKTS